MKIKWKLLWMEMVSLLLLGAILIVGSLNITLKEMDVMIEETLYTAVLGYSDDVYYLRNNGEDIDITVFEGDTRVASSIEGTVGTKASDIVIEKVLNGGQEYFDTDIVVNGQDYATVSKTGLVTFTMEYPVTVKIYSNMTDFKSDVVILTFEGNQSVVVPDDEDPF